MAFFISSVAVLQRLSSVYFCSPNYIYDQVMFTFPNNELHLSRMHTPSVPVVDDLLQQTSSPLGDRSEGNDVQNYQVRFPFFHLFLIG